jgi:hypothetical protein
MEENYGSNLKQNILGYFEKIEQQKKIKRDNNYRESYYYRFNQPKNIEVLELTSRGYIEKYNENEYNSLSEVNYYPQKDYYPLYNKKVCPKEKKEKGVWIGIL